MKNIKLVTLTAIVALALSGVARAETNTPPVKKIGIMDLSKVFDNYSKTKEYDAVLESKTKDYEKSRNEKIDKIKDLQNKVALMKDNEKEKANKELDQMKNDLMAYDQAQQTDLRKQRDEKIREILLEIEKVTSDFAKKEKFDIILNDKVLVYGIEGLDVSSQVLDVLNSSNGGKKK